MSKIVFWLVLTSPGLSAAWDIWTEISSVVSMNLMEKVLDSHAFDQNSTCRTHLTRFAEAISEERWARMMFDSMEKFPSGILRGRRCFIGNFDECLSVKAENFKGKYCMAKVHIGSEQLAKIDIPPEGSVLLYGVCLPSTCRTSDIEKAVSRLSLSEAFNLTINEDNCWTDDPITLEWEDWIAVITLGLVAFMALCSTIFDVLHQKNIVTAKRHELCASFSIYNNWKRLVKVSSKSGNISCLHGIRTLTMCWIILGHEYIMFTLSPTINTVVISPGMMAKERIPITNSFVSVDTFFLLSGLLVTLVFFRDIQKKKTYDVPVAMIHRLIRVTPAFAAMVLIQSTIILKMGRGPVWNLSVGKFVEQCKRSWLAGLTYLQNFLAPNVSCLGQSWYLSSDMQMFWLSPLLLYPMLLWPKISRLVYFLGLAAALLTNFAVSVSYQLGPHRSFTNNARQYELDYVQTHMRLSSYIIGMGLGYIICGIKGNKIHVNLNKVWVITGWLISVGLCLGSMYGISYFFDHASDYTVLQSSFYLTFHRLGWSLGVSWVVFACVAGYGEPVNHILSWDGFQILGKLAYSMFLVHATIQMYRLGLTQTSSYISDQEIVSSYFSTLVLTLMFSLPLYLLFEAPFGNMDHYFLGNLEILPYPKPKAKGRGQKGVQLFSQETN